jgi:mycothiol synthase
LIFTNSVPGRFSHMQSDSIHLPSAPALPGLRFRRFQGDSDFPLMVPVANACFAADRTEIVRTVDEMRKSYAELVNCDPYEDMILAEIDGELIGYVRGWWWAELAGPVIYCHLGFVLPAWRRKGIGRAMLHWMQGRQRAIASTSTSGTEHIFQVSATQYEVGLTALLRGDGFQPTRYFFSMVRPHLDDIQDFALPAGVALRPALPEHYRAIWDTSRAAFAQHWGMGKDDQNAYDNWLKQTDIFQPQLWQVAWDIVSNQIVGQIRTYIYEPYNRNFQRQRGWTEFVSVHKDWRKRGLARALVSHSLRAQRDAGMTESALGVDSENATGATRVYEACGFHVVKTNTVYRKPL